MEDSARTIFPLEKFMMQPLSKKMLFCIFFHVIDRAILVSFFLREGARNGNLEFRFLLKTFAYNNPCNVETFDSLDIHFTLLATEIPRHFFLIYSFYCWWWWCIFSLNEPRLLVIIIISQEEVSYFLIIFEYCIIEEINFISHHIWDSAEFHNLKWIISIGSKCIYFRLGRIY